MVDITCQPVVPREPAAGPQRNELPAGEPRSVGLAYRSPHRSGGLVGRARHPRLGFTSAGNRRAENSRSEVLQQLFGAIRERKSYATDAFAGKICIFNTVLAASIDSS